MSKGVKIAKYIPPLKLLDPSKRNYSYEYYTFIAPAFLGVVNVVSLYIAKQYNASSASRYLALSVLVPTFLLWLSYAFKMYNYTATDWIYYTVLIYLAHFVVWNYLVAYLDRHA